MESARQVKVVKGMLSLVVLVLFMIPIVMCTNAVTAPVPEVPDLKVSVSIRGMDLFIQNNDNFDWTDCEVTVNPSGFSANGFDANLGSIAPKATREIDSASLAAGDGTRFDLLTHKLKTVYIRCSTPAGMASAMLGSKE
jgi:hypothetical protein